VAVGIALSVLLHDVQPFDFPIRYFEPGTTVVADPNATPALSVPKLKTRPLASGSTP